LEKAGSPDFLPGEPAFFALFSARLSQGRALALPRGSLQRFRVGQDRPYGALKQVAGF
jgi:hypothetical protein